MESGVDKDLKDCPFCGGKADYYGSTIDGYGVQCDACGCCTATHNRGLYAECESVNKPLAAKDWNKRSYVEYDTFCNL